MNDDDVDLSKRRFLVGATVAAGGVLATGFAAGFITYWGKPERALALGAPVEVDISNMSPGQLVTEEWRSKPIWILRRTPEMLTDLDTLEKNGVLKDPKSDDMQPSYIKAENYRAIDKEYLVVVGLCTHLGCSPKQIKKNEQHDLGTDWLGGFLCACHGSKFDFSGRVYGGVPAQQNLEIPSYTITKSGSTIKVNIGVDPKLDPAAKGKAKGKEAKS